MADTFTGDNAALISAIDALLSLDADGVLRPHGIGSHARTLLASAAARLASPQARSVPDGWRLEKSEDGRTIWVCGRGIRTAVEWGEPMFIMLNRMLVAAPAPQRKEGE